jgi:hypothetical protein
MTRFARMQLFAALVAGFLARIAMAQGLGPPSRDSAAIAKDEERRALVNRGLPAEFGPLCCSILQIPASAFQAVSGAGSWVWSSTGYLYAPPFGISWAPVQLPTGSVVAYLDLYYDDQDPSQDFGASLYLYPGYGGQPEQLIRTVTSTGSSGKGYSFSGPFSYRIYNNPADGGGQHSVVMSFPFGGTLGFKGVDLWYYREVAPAPLTATFNDVPTSHPFFQFIEAIYAAGITVGCGGGNFCPDQPITRKQEAAFIAKALGLYWPY